MKSITIISDDRVGLLADISYVLGKASVNIEGLYVDVISGKAVISLEVQDQKRASEVLANSGFRTADLESIVIRTSNDSVEKITEMLEEENVHVKDVARILTDKAEGIFTLVVDKPRKAAKMLNPFIFGHQNTGR